MRVDRNFGGIARRAVQVCWHTSRLDHNYSNNQPQIEHSVVEGCEVHIAAAVNKYDVNTIDLIKSTHAP